MNQFEKEKSFDLNSELKKSKHKIYTIRKEKIKIKMNGRKKSIEKYFHRADENWDQLFHHEFSKLTGVIFTHIHMHTKGIEI